MTVTEPTYRVVAILSVPVDYQGPIEFTLGDTPFRTELPEGGEIKAALG